MRKARPAALVGAGPVSLSFLARIPGLRDELGPVKGPIFRVASRLANTLRAGYAVKTWEELEPCTLVLIAVPEARLPATIRELAGSPLDWRRKSAVLCGTERDSTELAPLAARGASTASLDEIGGFEGLRFVVEGDRAAVREVRRLVERGGAKVHVIRTSGKALYTAGVSFSTSLLTPLLEASVECLRRAGLISATAEAVAGALMHRSLRSYLKAGKRRWSGPPGQGSTAEIERARDALARADPRIREYFESSYRRALEALKLRT